MAITTPKVLVPAAMLAWSGLAVAMLSARQGEPVLAIVPSSAVAALPPTLRSGETGWRDISLRFDEASPFESRWDDAVPDDPPSLRYGEAGPLLKKQDRLPLAMVADVVIAERITPAPTAPVIVSPVVMLADEDKPAAPHRRHVMNVCASHGMHKVAMRGGRSWRCRK